MMALSSLGTVVDEGWEAIAARKKAAMAMLPQSYDIGERIRWDKSMSARTWPGSATTRSVPTPAAISRCRAPPPPTSSGSAQPLRTHLQRMFDKTGTRSQATLVRALLSAEAPIK
jgi:hypothetical protein